MDETTKELMSSVMVDDFKKEIIKFDNVIRLLKTQVGTLENNIEEKKKELSDIEQKIENLNNELDSKTKEHESLLNSKSDEYEKHVNSVQESLLKRENDLQDGINKLSDDKKSHDKNVMDLNQRSIQINMVKNSLIEELKTMQFNLNENITEAIEDIQRL